MSEEPETDAHIRALLADLGSGPAGESMPPEVAARLDDTLARLVAERGATGSEDQPSAPVLALPRRRWLPRAAVAAAAAVIVLGVGGLAASELGVLGTDGATTAEGGAASSEKSEDRVQATAPEAAAVPQLTAAAFADEVDGLLRGGDQQLRTPEDRAGTAAEPRADAREPNGGSVPGSPNALSSGPCPGPGTTDGAVTNQVQYDGRPAVLVVHPERPGRAGRPASRLVEAWDCAGGRKLDSTTLTR